MYEHSIKLKICENFPNGTSIYKDYKAWTYWKVLSEFCIALRVLFNV